MKELKMSINQMEKAGVETNDMIILISIEYAKSLITSHNAISLNKISKLSKIYGIETFIVRTPKDAQWYIITKEYWNDIKDFIDLSKE